MNLRKTDRVDYLKMSKTGKDEVIVENDSSTAEILDVDEVAGGGIMTDASSDYRLHELKDLEEQLKRLEVEEKIQELQMKVEGKKTAIKAMKQRPAPQLASANQGEPMNLGEIYQNELKTCPCPSVNQHPAKHENLESLLRMDLNPQSYLYSPSKEVSNGKYKYIPDFIPKSARTHHDEENEYEILPDVKLTTGKKNKLDNVTAAQWVAASSCILAELVDEYTGDTAQLTRDYMTHMTKVGIMATHYTWRSVIRWDDEYREKQHLYKFRWGCDSAHLSLVILTPRVKDNEKSSKSQKSNTESSAGNSSAPRVHICYNWNKGVACNRVPCRYEHKCEWCKSPSHPKIRHDDQSRQVPQGPTTSG